MLKYQQVEANMTLEQGIKELRDFEGPEGDTSIAMGPQMAHVMAAHDAVHVVFGCSTDMKDEALAHFVMILGTNVTLADMRAVAKSREHKNVVSKHSKFEIAKVVLGAPIDLLKVLKLKRRMKAKWPWHGYADYLSRPINDIRREFGILPIAKN